MQIPFMKMQSAGNDYIYMDCSKWVPKEPGIMARTLAKRRFSIGSDGLVLILPSRIADGKMRMFNADGSEGKMCGNAVRCVGKYLYDSGRVSSSEITVETDSGVRRLQIQPGQNNACNVSADMGFACFVPKEIPVSAPSPCIDRSIELNGIRWQFTALSVGNPHAVVFAEDPHALDLAEWGPLFEHHPLFPERINTEFVRIIDSNTLAVRVWERGSGETAACGTGACAAVAAAVRTGRITAGEWVAVLLPGGTLKVLCEADFHLTLAGLCETVYAGEFTCPADAVQALPPDG